MRAALYRAAVARSTRVPITSAVAATFRSPWRCGAAPERAWGELRSPWRPEGRRYALWPMVSRIDSVDQRNQSPRSLAIRPICLAELRGEQRFLGIHPRHHDPNRERQDEEGQQTAKEQHPADEQQERAEIAGVADHSVPPIRHQLVSLLNGNEGAEAPAKDQHRPHAQHA